MITSAEASRVNVSEYEISKMWICFHVQGDWLQVLTNRVVKSC
jgi:hypothetical protein